MTRGLLYGKYFIYASAIYEIESVVGFLDGRLSNKFRVAYHSLHCVRLDFFHLK